MSLLRTEVQIRPRGSWESLDLGFAMARRWLPALLGLWLSTAVPVALALILTLGTESWLSFCLWWWFKPLYEWPLLHYLSQRVFAKGTHAIDSMAMLKPKHLPCLLPYLLWRRFSVIRGFSMPVGMLEGLSGKVRSKRVALLGRGQSHVTWLMIVCVHFEFVMNLTLYLGILLFGYQEVAESNVAAGFIALIEQSPWLAWLVLLLQTVVVVPFYVAGAFAAYLSRRTQLEAWDLELIFRALGQRLHSTATDLPARELAHATSEHVKQQPRPLDQARQGMDSGSRLLGLSIFFLGLGIFGHSEAYSQTNSADHLEARNVDVSILAADEPVTDEPGLHVAPTDPLAARRLIEAVMAAPEFGQMQTESYWRYRETTTAAVDGEEVRDQLPTWLGVVATVLQLFAWVILFAAVAWLGLYLFRAIGWLRPRLRAKITLDSEGDAGFIPLVEAHQDSLRRACDAYSQGHYREALALLYRASLGFLVQEQGLMVPESATEGECRRLVEQRCPPAVAQYFSHLTQLWVRTAYAHHRPLPTEVDSLLQRWPQVFQVGAR